MNDLVNDLVYECLFSSHFFRDVDVFISVGFWELNDLVNDRSANVFFPSPVT